MTRTLLTDAHAGQPVLTRRAHSAEARATIAAAAARADRVLDLRTRRRLPGSRRSARHTHTRLVAALAQMNRADAAPVDDLGRSAVAAGR